MRKYLGILGVIILVFAFGSLALGAGKGTNFHGADINAVLNEIFNVKADFAKVTIDGAINITDAQTLGNTTLAGGTIVVNSTEVLASSIIFVTRQAPNTGTVGDLYIPTIVAGANFTINSTAASDNSTVSWFVVN